MGCTTPRYLASAKNDMPRMVTCCSNLYLRGYLEYCVYCERLKDAVFVSNLWSTRYGEGNKTAANIEVYHPDSYRRLYPEDCLELGFFMGRKLVMALHIVSRGQISAIRCLWENGKSHTCRIRAGRVG